MFIFINQLRLKKLKIIYLSFFIFSPSVFSGNLCECLSIGSHKKENDNSNSTSSSSHYYSYKDNQNFSKLHSVYSDIYDLDSRSKSDARVDGLIRKAARILMENEQYIEIAKDYYNNEKNRDYKASFAAIIYVANNDCDAFAYLKYCSLSSSEFQRLNNIRDQLMSGIKEKSDLELPRKSGRAPYAVSELSSSTDDIPPDR